MVENLVQAFLMVEWFRLSVSLDSNWSEIVHCAVFMADGIPVFQYTKVRRLFWGYKNGNVDSQFVSYLVPRLKYLIIVLVSVFFSFGSQGLRFVQLCRKFVQYKENKNLRERKSTLTLSRI